MTSMWGSTTHLGHLSKLIRIQYLQVRYNIYNIYIYIYIYIYINMHIYR